jgi:hypothetical protein
MIVSLRQCPSYTLLAVVNVVHSDHIDTLLFKGEIDGRFAEYNLSLAFKLASFPERVLM